MVNQPSKALLMFSGGQDSATCLAWACEKFAHVETIGFDYGQRHDVEMSCRKTVLSSVRDNFSKWDKVIGKDHIIDLSVLGQISETALTRDMGIEASKTGLPNTFVPGRNLIFLNFAAALGYRRGITTLIGGMCEADFSGYPDCRTETLETTMASISLGMDRPFTLETPLMHLSKSDAWVLAYELGGDQLVKIILEDTHTCYLGERGERHGWGYGCGNCPACRLRQKGWDAYDSGQPVS